MRCACILCSYLTILNTTSYRFIKINSIPSFNVTVFTFVIGISVSLTVTGYFFLALIHKFPSLTRVILHSVREISRLGIDLCSVSGVQ